MPSLIHMGTALNKVLKDFIVRYKIMAGFRAPYVPGLTPRPYHRAFGYPRDGADKPRSFAELGRDCQYFALRHVETQKKQFKRLGPIADYDNPYRPLARIRGQADRNLA
jgi:isoleucyl-tRNA synthetase